MIVLAIDPGNDKCGIAVVDSDSGVLHKSIVPTSELGSSFSDIINANHPQVIIMGNGTGSRKLIEHLVAASEGRDILLVDEEFTTLEARRAYYEENPPAGLMRLVPRGLLVPNVPLDDYVAVILANRFIKNQLPEPG
jgi:RNase H-fold protein (predicted Holliday junction resolvase)